MVDKQINKKKQNVKIKKRPRRIFKDKRGFYFLTSKGKKSYIKVPPTVSQRQVVKVNVMNIIPIGKRIRKKKRKIPRVGKKIDTGLRPIQREGLPAFTISPIDRRLKNIEEQKKDLEDAEKKIDKAVFTVDLEKLFKTMKEKTETGPKTRFLSKGDALIKEIEEMISKPTKKPKIAMRKDFFRKQVKLFLKDNPTALYPQLLSHLVNMKTFNEKYKIDEFFFDGPKYKKFLKIFNEEKDKVKPDEETKEESVIESIETDEFMGSGKVASTDGLWNTDVERLLKQRIKNYVPVLAADEVDNLPDLVGKGDRDFAFIVNTNPSSSDGTGTDGHRVGHWTCCYIDGEDCSIEYFDPLVEKKMPKHLVEVCKEIAKRLNPKHMFKVKSNLLQRQADESDTCGLHCIQFLSDRMSGMSFSEASGYDAFLEKGSYKDTEEGENYIAENFPQFTKYV